MRVLVACEYSATVPHHIGAVPIGDGLAPKS